MYAVEFNNNKTVLITNAVKVDVNHSLRAALFYGRDRTVVSYMKLDDVRMITKSDSPNIIGVDLAKELTDKTRLSIFRRGMAK